MRDVGRYCEVTRSYAWHAQGTVNTHTPDAERFFPLLKRERIKEKIHETREEARGDIPDDIEFFITVNVGLVQAIELCIAILLTVQKAGMRHGDSVITAN